MKKKFKKEMNELLEKCSIEILEKFSKNTIKYSEGTVDMGICHICGKMHLTHKSCSRGEVVK